MGSMRGNISTGISVQDNYKNIIDFTPSGTITSGTYADITGISNTAFTTPLAATYEIHIYAQMYQASTTGFRDIQLEALIDDATEVQIPLTELSFTSTTTTVMPIIGVGTAVLTKGAHTIRLRGKMTGGSGGNATTFGTWRVLIKI